MALFKIPTSLNIKEKMAKTQEKSFGDAASEENLRERRYFWTARGFAMIFVVSLITNILMLLSLSSLVPLVRVQPYKLTFSDKKAQTVTVKPYEINETLMKGITADMVRQYVTLRKTITSDLEEMGYRWGKNGPVDFQPREPFSPLFGALKKTQIMAEVQITQEYLGYSDHLCYLATMWKEFLDYPTYHNGMDVKATTLNQKLTAISGVANTGTMKNWCGYVFAQSNWYCFGRLAWNPELKSSDIAREWVLQSLSKNPDAVEKIVDIMQKSREAVVDYMMPLGFHHLFGWSDHYGPQPWCAIEGARADWMPSYYHKADKNGVGFNRAVSGSNAVEQYQEPLRTMYNDPKLCPQEYLLWFHHLPWDYVFDNGSTLWVNICEHYYRGAQRVDEFRKTWKTLVGKVYSPQYSEVEKKLEIQYDEAQWWRDACLLYFSNISGLTIPENLGSQKYHSVEECEQKRMKKAYVERQRD